MVLLGNVASNIREDDDVGTHSEHKPAKRMRTYMDYKAQGVDGMEKKTFITFLHDINHHKVQAMKEHFSENGLTIRTHGNSLKRPHNALTFGTILYLLKFIQNYAEQNAILLPSRMIQKR